MMRFTMLGCGSSPGAPRITGDWGACDPNNIKNRRTRASFLIEKKQENGDTTSVVIDTGPDFRTQMLSANVTHLDAVVYTHAHADHIHGIDDLRGFWLSQKKRIDVYADCTTLQKLRESFGYCFKTPQTSDYAPTVEAHEITHYTAFEIHGKGGSIEFEPLTQIHGATHSIGYRVGSFAYCSDVSDFPSKTAERLKNLDILVIDALQYNPHPSHFSLDQALKWIENLAPKQAILTHMHTPLDYETVSARLPSHVYAGYDGLTRILNM